MKQAVYKNLVIAESDATIEIEGNAYFPPDSVNMALLEQSDSKTTCPWKGEARYYSVKTDDGLLSDAVWVYEEPSEKAAEIKGYFAFWKGVEVIDA